MSEPVDLNVIQRLEGLLNQKDREIAKLKEKQAERNYEDAWGWMKQDTSLELENLPVPRLEIRWARELGGWGWFAHYSLVYRFFLGEYIRLPISITRQTGGGRDNAPIREGKVTIPFRDGAHIQHDMRQLNLPGFAICEGTVTKLEPMGGLAPYEREST